MRHDQEQFLSTVRDYIVKNPEVAAYIFDFVAEGLIESRREILERAADMEVALSVAISSRYKGRADLILSKLKKWRGRSSLVWDETIAMLELKKPGERP